MESFGHRLHRARDYIIRHERHFSSVSLIAGFIFDFFTLWRIDLWAEDLIFIVYLGVAALGITYLTVREAEIVKGKWGDRFHTFFLLVLQFVFGGLFGRFFIFYSRSGSLAASWPFLLFIGILFAMNERLRKQYQLFAYRMSVYFITLFSFAIFYVPILAGEMSPQMFLLAGGISLIIIIVFAHALSAILKERVAQSRRILFWSIGAIYVAITIMYFANIIPPIPLSLEDSGVFHSIARQNGLYVGLRERRPWYMFFSQYEPIHLEAGKAVYIFSSIFAPTRISTTVVHDWQWYDDRLGEWVTISRIPYPIVGGRDGGYRGFTYKEHVRPGRWRVNILTERDQLIGRVKFVIVQTDTTPPLETKSY